MRVLVRVHPPVTLTDGNGRRARTVNSTTGTIGYFGYGADGRLLQDWSNRRNVRNGYIYLGNTLVGLYEVNLGTGAVASRYKHTDALGSPVATTDAAKAVLSRTSYTPYGVPMLPVDGVGYTGHFIDVNTSLTYMQQRYYDPQIGRFLSVDPVSTNPSTGGNFNRFWYANDNPYRFTDPDGRMTAEDRKEQAAVRRQQHEQNERNAHSGNGAGQTRSEVRGGNSVGIQNDQTKMPYDGPKRQGEEYQHAKTVGPWDASTAQGDKFKAQAAEQKSGLPGSFNGPADAFRHCAWSCEMARDIGIVQAQEVGDVHEAWNPGKPDENAMDLSNNAFGRALFGRSGTCPTLCGSAVESGNLIILPEGRWER